MAASPDSGGGPAADGTLFATGRTPRTTGIGPGTAGPGEAQKPVEAGGVTVDAPAGPQAEAFGLRFGRVALLPRALPPEGAPAPGRDDVGVDVDDRYRTALGLRTGFARPSHHLDTGPGRGPGARGP
ncbi:hypothetical protein LO771_29075 [Streptacidiphilus sp. ASG 303]|uniref:hypothetical protein n=1 Tax=Streptacidiphilus sp. ASG 303 TaxID=2896847 RepID=UPI001E5C5D00|nr:hypothetical protein [Streptacidiphilus sp. ASG 303]MCD0486326.1 hypothetical protein [Streptacidiphilus sp. ASG 303]